MSSPFNSQEALEKAKQAVENDYAVVGVLEDLDTTFAVMEQYVPRFFKGVASIYRCMFYVNDFCYILYLILVWLLFIFYLFIVIAAIQSNRINQNTFKPQVSDYVKELLRQNFSREIAFYEFCKDRLHRQHRAMRLPSN